MIQMQTSLAVADNSGAKRVVMIMPVGGSTGKIARLGDRIKVTVKEASPDGAAKKGKVYNAVIVRTRKEVRRKDGSWNWILARGKVVARDAAGTPLRLVGTHIRASTLGARVAVDVDVLGRERVDRRMDHEDALAVETLPGERLA